MGLRKRAVVVYPIPKLYKSGFGILSKIYIKLSNGTPLYREYYWTLNWRNNKSAPISITKSLIKSLKTSFRVTLYDLTETSNILDTDFDVVIGHPLPKSFGVKGFKSNFSEYDDSQVLVKLLLCKKANKNFFAITPFNVSEDLFKWQQKLYSDSQIINYIGIGGEVWRKYLVSEFTNAKKNYLVEMFIDPKEFKFRKFSFSKPGKRRFLYLGRNSFEKGVDMMSAFALAYPSIDISYISSGMISGCNKIADYLTMNNQTLTFIAANYDFIISFSRFDAQATTIIEMASVGLIPVCTKTTGYDSDFVFELPLEFESIFTLLNKLNHEDESVLRRFQFRNKKIIQERYHHKIFEKKIFEIVNTNKYE